MTYLPRTTLSLAIIGIMTSQASFAATTQSSETPTTQLDALTVSIDRQGSKVATDVVTLKTMDESTATDLRGLLNQEPAIEVGGGNGTSQFFSIRGMGQNSIDIKVDNAYSDSQFLYHQARFMLDPALVKIVAVQKGAGSASAGIGATNGAIVAKTLDAKDLLENSSHPNYGAKVHANYSSNDGYGYGASIFGKAGNVDGLLSFNTVDDNDYKGGKGYKNPFGGDTVPNSALDKTSLLAKVGLDINDNHRLSLSHTSEEHEGIRAVREEFTWFERQYPVPTTLKQNTTNLEWTGKDLGFINRADANVYVMENERISSNDEKNGYAGNITGETTQQIQTRGANLNLDTQLADNHLLKYGINYRQQEAKPHALKQKGDTIGSGATAFVLPLDIVNQEKTDVGVYGELISTYGDFTVTTGLRYDSFDFTAMDNKKVSDGALSPSIGVIYQANPHLNLSANLNYATRSPRLYDTLIAAGHRGIVSIADDAEAEKARNTELGFNYNNGTVFADGSVFVQKINNALGGAAAARHGTLIKEIDNVGKISNKGYELNVGYRHNDLTARLGVADSKPKIDGLEMSGNPEYAVRTGRTWTGSVAYQFAKPNLEVGVRHRVVEGVDNGNAHLQSVAQNREGYNTSDIFANWKPYGNDKVNVNFSVNNIADKNYRPHSQRTSDTTLPGAGRDFRLGVNFTF